MFIIDTPTKQEAVNFATLMTCLEYTESRLEPLFNEFGQTTDLTLPIDDPEIISKYSEHFKIDSSYLLSEYKNTHKAFASLLEDDEIIKRDSFFYPPLLLKTEQI